ncbi:Glutamyl aminopeptidase [Camponotus floridanus]|uniref:Glutamyl aminopeptidase n=1 Tax=Camponotus floridanus TaxID=104421 RepID=E2A5C9_CAMFO|nr:Glutamyl aminopeptidase [Camponotus floridanus]
MYHHIILDSQNNITKKLILYRDATIFYNDELDSDIHKLDVIRRIGYELVHQWFDNLISPVHWPDYWLNEGIAILLGTDVINQDFEDLRMWDLFMVQIQQEALRFDNSPRDIMKPLTSEINKLSEIDSLFSFSFHIKAPVILRMLRHFLTDQVFQRGIEIFLSKHKFSSASIDDFWESMQSAHNATNMERIIVREIMNAWTKQKHYPILKVAQIYDYTNFHYVRITVENIENHWHIPVTITTQTTSNFTIHPWKFFYNWKKSNSTWFMDIATDGHIDDWIIANLQQIDMYNVNLDSHDNIAKKLILYRDATIFYNDELDPDMHKLDVTRTIGYELVHKWFDNLISPSWWSDYWLNEGIAILLGTDVINKGSEDLRMWDLFVVQIQQESLRLDNFTEGVMKPLRSEINKPSETDSLFSFSFHIKAPVILRMLRHFLTDQVFQNGIEIFLSKHKFSSASIDDFWESMQSAHNATNMEKIIVREIMNAWTKQKHYPILKVAQIYDYTNFHYVRITVENIENHWHIPVTITTQTTSNFTIHPWKFFYNWKKSNSTWFMDIATDGHIGDWIIANLQQIGYYRVNYELKNWQNIAKYLNSRNYSKIHVLNRAQIIDDAYYFLSSRKLDMSTFLDLAKYLSQETDFVAWYPMIKALENISSIFPISDTEDIDLFKVNNNRHFINKSVFHILYIRLLHIKYIKNKIVKQFRKIYIYEKI